jgi:hypothetical protein
LRLPGLIVGMTVYAAGIVLASFIAGLAAGSVIAGRPVGLAGCRSGTASRQPTRRSLQ